MLTATRLVVRTACSALLLLSLAGTASASNVLVNPGFEAGGVGYGAPGWFVFGNVFTESVDGGCIAPYSGTKLVKMFGGFSGGFNVGGIFQELPTNPGDAWTFSAKSRHCGGDPLTGVNPTGNWVVMKLAFFDAGNNEIAPAAVESVILSGTFPTDFWIDNAPIVGVTPAGAVKVQAFILFLQPGFDGGAALIDDLDLQVSIPTPARAGTWGALKRLYR